MRAWIGSCVVAVIAVFAALAPGSAATGNVTVSWYANAVVKVSLTPNYATGYGPVKAQFGTQPTPAPGPAACYQGCAVDFGSVLGGTDYLYKYAAHLNVQTNDPGGFILYGEGAADFYNNSDGTSQSLDQTIYYLPSSSGADSNTGFSAALPFYKTSSTSVTQGTYGTSAAPGTPGTITYASCQSGNISGCPSTDITTVGTPTSDLYYDYQLKVPAMATGGAYYVWIVYTVVAS